MLLRDDKAQAMTARRISLGKEQQVFAGSLGLGAVKNPTVVFGIEQSP